MFLVLRRRRTKIPKLHMFLGLVGTVCTSTSNPSTRLGCRVQFKWRLLSGPFGVEYPQLVQHVSHFTLGLFSVANWISFVEFPAHRSTVKCISICLFTAPLSLNNYMSGRHWMLQLTSTDVRPSGDCFTTAREAELPLKWHVIVICQTYTALFAFHLLMDAVT